MTVFYTTLLSTFILGVFSRLTEKDNKNVGMLFAFFAVIIFVLVSGLRKNIGDTEAYIHSYEQLANFAGLAEDGKDKGFTIFSLFLYNINSDPQFMIFVCAFITTFINMNI